VPCMYFLFMSDIVSIVHIILTIICDCR
jgi:hypothetical protein